MKRRSKNVHPERDVVLQKMASDLEYVSYEIDPYEYKDQYGSYPSERGFRDAFELLLTADGLDTAIGFVEDGMGTDPTSLSTDLLARLKARRKEMAPVVSRSWRPKRPVKSRNGKRFCRAIFDIDGVNLSIDYSDIRTSDDDSLEDVLRKYDAAHGTDFYPRLGDDAIAYRWVTEDEIPSEFRDAIPVRSWKEAERVATKAGRGR